MPDPARKLEPQRRFSKMFHETVDEGTVLTLSRTATRVWILLLRMADEARFCWPGVDYIAERINSGPRAVYYALNELEQASLIRRVSGGGRTHNAYRLVD